MLSGHATPQATAAYAAAHPQIAYRPLGETGLLVSPAGFGSYRVDIHSHIFHEALALALRQGVNLIDTSTNYADGSSEELVGTVMRRLHDEGAVLREAVVVVTKGGYLQGQNHQISQQRQAEGRGWPDLVPYGPGLEHCIHPQFLEDQITRSLRRLQMECVDIYLLHNPEYYLSWAKREGRGLRDAREEYARRLRLAFGYLEEEVARGRIRWYGVSSNTFPTPASDPDHTSLAGLWQIAEEIGPDHHFRVVQLPMNLLEPGAATEPNQPGGESVLAFARAHGLAVLTNRPLNAIHGERLLRLADVPVEAAADPEAVEEAIARLQRREEKFRSEILPVLPAPESMAQQLLALFTVGRLLAENWRRFGSYQQWLDVQTQILVPRAQGGIDYLSRQQTLPPEAGRWLQKYVRALNEALQAVSHVYQEQGAEQARAMRERVAALDPAWAEAPTLSQMALRALRSTAGITSVLVGMRHESYVEDVLAELRRPVEVAGRQEAWQALAAGVV
ncbi:MAG: aldo/keto reductase [Chloroflexi bacterium]|jgi:aryl-alcohol dehydrogenase-like predicted oxidoreductase|nr:aldo/keto reductase [Chloroflexota bacterium]